MNDLSGTFKLVTIWLVIGAATFLGVKTFGFLFAVEAFQIRGETVELFVTLDLARARQMHHKFLCNYIVVLGVGADPEQFPDRTGCGRGRPPYKKIRSLSITNALHWEFAPPAPDDAA